MSLAYLTYVVGPLQNNSYLLWDDESREAVVIDPGFGCDAILKEIHRQELTLKAIWITHAHFDHIGGVDEVASAFQPAPHLHLHQLDMNLWKQGGGSRNAGFGLKVATQPDSWLEAGMRLKVGEHSLEVRHAPGHTRGSVIFYSSGLKAAFVGDVIFRGGRGRTDLAGGDEITLLQSIRREVLSLPPDTMLLSGHGEETSVGRESRWY